MGLSLRHEDFTCIDSSREEIVGEEEELLFVKYWVFVYKSLAEAVKKAEKGLN